MGTNYYATEAPCPEPCAHCTVREFHIGKNLVMFEAHDSTPWGPIRSWSDWKDALLCPPRPTIADEYGREYTAEEFIALVEETDPAQRRRQYEWVIEHHGRSDHDWLDGDQFSITDREFT